MDITVALGGGGSRGTAHIGVLRAMEKSGFNIRAIAGTSIGSIIGAFYVIGRTPDEIEAIFSAIDQSKLYGWPLSGGPGLLSLRRIHEFLKTNFGQSNFEDLKLPFAAVSVDLNSNREIILDKGCVVNAILASITIPGLFPPKEMDEMFLPLINPN
jgi:NTE family protein